MVAAAAVQVSVVRQSETEPGEWEQRVQLRLMELDVDPGNDADRGLSKGGET
jgi:hypothetical protein